MTGAVIALTLGVLGLITLPFILGYCSSDNTELEMCNAYESGYSSGFNGTEAMNKNCSDYYDLYVCDKGVICAQWEENATFQYCRGYMEGYNDMLENERTRKIYENVSINMN